MPTSSLRDIMVAANACAFRCYQCMKPCNYLFGDARCKDCTRLTPEEVRGEEEPTD